MRANFRVVRNSIAIFPIAVHWSNIDILKLFATNLQNIIENAISIEEVTSALNEFSKSRDTAKLFTSLTDVAIADFNTLQTRRMNVRPVRICRSDMEINIR